MSGCSASSSSAVRVIRAGAVVSGAGAGAITQRGSLSTSGQRYHSGQFTLVEISSLTLAEVHKLAKAEARPLSSKYVWQRKVGGEVSPSFWFEGSKSGESASKGAIAQFLQ